MQRSSGSHERAYIERSRPHGREDMVVTFQMQEVLPPAGVLDPEAAYQAALRCVVHPPRMKRPLMGLRLIGLLGLGVAVPTATKVIRGRDISDERLGERRRQFPFLQRRSSTKDQAAYRVHQRQSSRVTSRPVQLSDKGSAHRCRRHRTYQHRPNRTDTRHSHQPPYPSEWRDHGAPRRIADGSLR